jgi:hypothetical protein
MQVTAAGMFNDNTRFFYAHDNNLGISNLEIHQKIGVLKHIFNEYAYADERVAPSQVQFIIEQMFLESRTARGLTATPPPVVMPFESFVRGMRAGWNANTKGMRIEIK